jgi:hypothetical protein
MNGNVTGGILLIIGATVLIAIGMTDKGKQIIGIITGSADTQSYTQGDTYSGSGADATISGGTNTIFNNAGHRPASTTPILLNLSPRG